MKTLWLVLWLLFLFGGSWMGYRAWWILNTRQIDEAGLVVWYLGISIILFILSIISFFIWR